MIKIYRYELQYVLLNKLFIGFSTLLFIFSYYLLNQTLILGISYTAPFSIYSYAYYCLLLLPLIFIGETTLNQLYFNNAQQKRQILFERCSYPKITLERINLFTLLTALMIWIFIILCSALLFYSITFQIFQPFKFLLLSYFLLFPPAFCFLFINYQISKIHPSLSLVICLIFILFTQINIESNPFSSAYFIQAPLQLPLDTAAAFPFVQYINRLLLINLPLLSQIRKKAKIS